MRRIVALIAAAMVVGASGCGGNDHAGASGATRTETTASTTRTVAAPERCRPGSDGFVALACLRLPRRVAPPHVRATAFRLHGGDEPRALVKWTSFDLTADGFGIWRRSGGRWLRMYRARSGPPDGRNPYEMAFTFGDVTQDNLLDVLVEQQLGTAACGPRELLAIERTRVTRLFRRSACEVSSSVRDGRLAYRDTVGGCRVPAAHCYSGVRVDLRGYRGHRLVNHRVFVRCFHRVQPGHRGCPEVRDRLAMH